MLLVRSFFVTVLLGGCLSSECSTEALETKLLKLEKLVLAQAKSIQFLERTLKTKHRSDLDADISQSQDKVKRAAETVAFTAYLDHDVIHVGADQVYPFNRVVTNIGGGFNPNTHVFTCLVDGVYQFSFYIAAWEAKELVARLVVDGNNIVDAIAEPTNTGSETQGSNTAVLQLRSGQTIWVANFGHGEAHLRSDSNYRYTTFSGVLIQAL